MSTSLFPGAEPLSYVYAVTRPAAGVDAALRDATGMDGGTLRTVRSAGLAAVVCDVPGEKFDEAGLRAQLEDLEQLEHLARAHHDVVESLAARETVLPLRLATVYRDDERVAAMLAASQEAFEERLELLDDTVEWGVKIYLSAAESAQTEEAAPADAATTPGREFLRRRRAQRDSRQQAYRAAGEAAGRVQAAASAYARAHVAHRPQQGRLAVEAGESGENLVNDAYLVRRTLGEEFTAAVAAAAREEAAVHVTVTGPWAPYSFAAPEAETREPADV